MHQQFSFFAAFSFFTAIKPSTKRLANKRLATKHLRSTAAVVGSALALGGCASTTGNGVMDANSTIGTANNVGMAIFKAAVNQQCQTQLQNNQYWRLGSVLMTSDKQAQVASNVCGCVSEKAPQSVTIVDLTTAAVDPTARNVIVARAVSNTLQQCVGEFVK
nr:hypothetical protein [Moraxella osloensis]